MEELLTIHLSDFDYRKPVRRQGQSQVSALQVTLRSRGNLCSLLELSNLRLRKVAGRSHLFVSRVNVPVIGVNCRNERVLVASALEVESNRFGGPGLFRRRVVPNGDHQTAIL